MGRSYDIMRDAAFVETGRKWRRAIIAWEVTKVAAPWVAGAVILGTLGYGAYWVWAAWLVPAFTPDPAAVDAPAVTTSALGAVPGWLWFAALALVGAAFWLFRPGRVVYRPQLRIVQAACLLIVAAGVAGAGLFGITH